MCTSKDTRTREPWCCGRSRREKSRDLAIREHAAAGVFAVLVMYSSELYLYLGETKPSKALSQEAGKGPVIIYPSSTSFGHGGLNPKDPPSHARGSCPYTGIRVTICCKNLCFHCLDLLCFAQGTCVSGPPSQLPRL